MTPDPIPHRAPIKGGGRCDICGNRSFRTTRLGGWRHAGCEPTDRHLTVVERGARTEARRWGGIRDSDSESTRVAEVVQLPIRTNGNGHKP